MAFAQISDILRFFPNLHQDSGGTETREDENGDTIVDAQGNPVEFPLTDWQWTLDNAEEDLKKMIYVEWYQKEGGSYYYSNSGRRNRFRQEIFTWNPDLLREEQWTTCTALKAIADYILPQMATYGNEDTHVGLMREYDRRFNEQFNLELSSGIYYDIDDDDTYERGERFITSKLNRIV